MVSITRALRRIKGDWDTLLSETFLREPGFHECRVRHHDNLARIEVPPAQVARFADPQFRAEVDARLRELGFQYVALDLRGFRSGSLNEVLPEKTRRR